MRQDDLSLAQECLRPLVAFMSLNILFPLQLALDFFSGQGPSMDGSIDKIADYRKITSNLEQMQNEGFN